MYVLTELGYVLICQVKEKEQKCSFENALVEKSESSTRNKNGLVEGLLLFSIIEPSFQIVNRLFILSFEDNTHRTSYKRYEMKDYNFVIDGQNFFD